MQLSDLRFEIKSRYESESESMNLPNQDFVPFLIFVFSRYDVRDRLK